MTFVEPLHSGFRYAGGESFLVDTGLENLLVKGDGQPLMPRLFAVILAIGAGELDQHQLWYGRGS
jgi:hypothetical protein